MIAIRDRLMSRPPAAGLRLVTLAVTAFCALNALGGGVGLIFTGLGVPETELDGTPFSSFMVPGLLLAGVVGGTMALATVLLWRRHPLATAATMVAGMTMLIWIIVEAAMIHDGRPLQVVVALLALVTIGLALWSLGEERHPWPWPGHRHV